jgi:hypothetical protein
MFKSLDIWLPAYLLRSRRISAAGSPRHVLLCICDHFEPFRETDRAGALERVDQWLNRFPKQTEPFRDANGAGPKQTFFYPIEQYDQEIINRLAELCRDTGCEVEVHLHHKDDTAANLRATLERGKERLVRHGLLSRDAAGRVRYGFIHGNWALDNSHPHRCHCGVQNELAVLGETGCFADFTLPSAPNRAQTRIINSLYYASGTAKPKSHDRGVLVEAGKKPSGDLLLVQGPLGLNWKKRKFGFLPGIENSDLTGANPPTLLRLKTWLDLGIHVVGRPDWLFVKLHTHGAMPRNTAMFLGEPMQRFHRDLSRFASENKGLHFHYVTAREMVNILHAAEDGHSGDPGEFRNYRYQSLIVRA